MKWLVAVLGVCLVTASASADEPAIFKEPLDPRVRSSQFTVYSRVHPGFGVQLRKKRTLNPEIAGTVGFLLLGLPGIAAGPMAKHSRYSPSSFSLDSVRKLSVFFDATAAQSALEQALTESVGSLPLVTTPPLFKPLAPGVEVLTGDMKDDPVLIVDVYASLTASYRALQVTALVYGLSPAKMATDPLSNKTGRVYLNRFDYISDPLPAPTIPTEEERKTKLQDIRARYAGDLTAQQKKNRKHELELVDGTLSPADESAATLLDLWLAQDGVRARTEFQRGISEVTTLMKVDLTDVSAVVPVAAEVSDPVEVMHDGGSRRTVRYLAQPFAGAVMSIPASLNDVSCQVIAFAAELPDGGAILCGEAAANFGAVCMPGQAYAQGRCNRVRKARS